MQKSVPKPIPYHLMEQIREGIITGKYPPGSSLREQGLEKEFGCSRGPIREALRLLQHRGLVTHEPRRGFRVLSLTATNIRQLYNLRAVLESHAIEGLEGHISEALLDELNAANAAMRRHLKARQIKEYLQSNLVFHALILRHAPNPILERTINSINELGEPLRHAMLRNRTLSTRAVDEHDELVALLRKNAIADAVGLMKRHIIGSIPTALGALE